jgi:hypothetical protein
VLYPDESAKWRIQAVPRSPDSFESRKALPEPWRGLRDEELSAKTGVPGCIFIHASGFIGGARVFPGVPGCRLIVAQVMRTRRAPSSWRISPWRLDIFPHLHPSYCPPLVVSVELSYVSGCCGRGVRTPHCVMAPPRLPCERRYETEADPAVREAGPRCRSSPVPARDHSTSGPEGID